MEKKEKKQCELKEYYIAYLDLLGYKDFFKENPDSVSEFFNDIKSAIAEAKKIIKETKKLNYRLFSDNIVIYTEVQESSTYNDVANLLGFLISVASVQRKFIINHNLFLRGGITKGKMCVEKEFLFGQGIIDVVEMEKEANYPRIILSEKVVSLLENYKYISSKDINRAKTIRENQKEKKEIKETEKLYLDYCISRMKLEAIIKHMNYYLVFAWKKNEFVLNYIDDVEGHDIPIKNDIEVLEGLINKDYENDNNHANASLEKDLEKHCEKVKNKIKQYAGKANINPDMKEEEKREKILKKYIWVSIYHNAVCEMYNLSKFKIGGAPQLDDITLKLHYYFTNKKLYSLKSQKR